MIEELQGRNEARKPAKDAVIQGQWRLLWSEQADDANPLQKALSGQVRCHGPRDAIVL